MKSVLRILLPIVALALAAIALLNFLRAPDTVWGWKLALVAGEFGHWLVLAPLVVGGAAAIGLSGGWRWAVVSLCALAAAGLLRPAFSAWRIGRGLGEGAFAWTRLWSPPDAAPMPVVTEVFARPDGQELRLDLYRTVINRPGGRPPCLIVVHGGGWDSGDRTQLAGWNHRWAERGWAVAAVSYRLAPRWTWPAPREDVRAAIAWLKQNAERLAINPHKLVLLGRSAGGQIATAVAYGAADPDIAGVIALYAPHDMPFAWGVSREDDALNSVRLMRQYLGGPPDTPERRALYESASGHLMVRRGVPPTLLIHGFPDTLVWYRHSRRLAAELEKAGAPHRHLELPWATHGFDFNPDGPAGQLADWEIARFLERVAR